MNLKPTINYPPPGQGLPAPDPFPAAAKPKWNKPRRKRRNPKNPWFCAYTGDEWRHHHGAYTYRFMLHIIGGRLYCRVTKRQRGSELTSIEIDREAPAAAMRFKELAVAERLQPVKRPNKYRNGLSLTLWGWPVGFVKD